MPKSKPSCHPYAFITVLLWATSYVATNVIMQTFSSGPLALLRCLVASLVLLAIMRRQRIPFPARAELPQFLVSGLLGLSLYTVLFNQGTKTLSPTTSCIMIATSPIIIALLARLLLRERLTAAGWTAICLAFAGVLVMALWNGSVDANWGILWTGLAAICTSFYSIVQRRLSSRFLPLQITAMCFLAASLELIFFVPELAAQISRAPAWHTLVAVYMGVFPSAVGYLLWVKAISLADRTSQVANYMYLTPFLSLLLEMAILRQFPDTGTILGGAIILAGLGLFSLAGKPADSTAKTRNDKADAGHLPDNGI